MTSRTPIQCLRVLLYPLQFDTSQSALDDYFEARFRDFFERNHTPEERSELRAACSAALDDRDGILLPVSTEWSMEPATVTDILNRFVAAFDRWF